MAREITLDVLRGMTVDKRHRLYMNASGQAHTPDGAALKRLI